MKPMTSRLTLLGTALSVAVLSACGGGSGEATATEAPSATEQSSQAAGLADSGATDNDAPVVEPDPAEVATPAPSPAPAPEPAPELTPEPAPAPESAPEPGAAIEDPAVTFESGEQLVESADGQLASLDGLASLGSAVVQGRTWFDVDPGRLFVQFQGGDVSERYARIAAGPDSTTNHALEFRLNAANVRDSEGVATKGRIQLNAYAIESVRAREVRLRTRMFLGAGFAQLRTLPQAFRWLTISEWWNNAGWTGEAYPFRITVDITKPATAVGARLYFAARAETLNLATNKWSNTVWTQTNTDYPVPIGQWVTLEYHFREGDSQTGRFYVAAVTDDGQRTVLFDRQGWTYHPDDPAPDGLTHLNPIKLYTSKALIDHAREAGQPLSLYWDNIGFRLCRELVAVDQSPCRPETFR